MRTDLTPLKNFLPICTPALGKRGTFRIVSTVKCELMPEFWHQTWYRPLLVHAAIHFLCFSNSDLSIF